MKLLFYFLFSLYFINSKLLIKSLPENLGSSDKFETDILRSLNQMTKGNILFSPFSLYSILALTANGAVGDTQKEILSVMKFDNLLRSLNSKMRILNEKLFQSNQTFSRYNSTLRLGNAIFFKEKPSNWIQNLAQKYYRSKVEELRNSTQVNEFISKMTNERIKKMIDEKTVEDSKMILISSIFFQSAWKYTFPNKQIYNDTFYFTNNTNKNVTYLSQIYKRGTVRFFENDEVQIIEIPYNYTSIRASVILPKNMTLNEMINNTKKTSFTSLRQKLNTVYDVKLSLPKFQIDFDVDMKEALQKMGMTKSFDASSADFSKLTGNKTELYIMKVLQKTTLNVDEKGTEATSATAVSMGIRSSSSLSMTKTMIVNKPFIFLINHKDIEQSLFIAKVEEV
jgi:serine protease inhibitor